MTTKRARAKDVVKERSRGDYWLDHAVIVDKDYEWLATAEKLTLWNVQIPLTFLARLDRLWWLDIRGGSAHDLNILHGTTCLQYLAINQVRGLCDLSIISELHYLCYLELYGLPKVTNLPSLDKLTKLMHVNLGQLRGLTSLKGILKAPNISELQFIRKINVNAEDVEQIANHPTLKHFGWFAEDIPFKVWNPVVKRIGLPELTINHPEEWFALRNT